MALQLNGYPTINSGPDEYREVTTSDVPNSKVALDVAIKEGSVTATMSGLAIAGKVSKVIVDSDQWYAFPPVALANRNAMSMQNLSGVDLLLNYSISSPSTEGITIPNGYERQYDITPGITLYIRRKSGSGPVSVWCEELS